MEKALVAPTDGLHSDHSGLLQNNCYHWSRGCCDGIAIGRGVRSWRTHCYGLQSFLIQVPQGHPLLNWLIDLHIYHPNFISKLTINQWKKKFSLENCIHLSPSDTHKNHYYPFLACTASPLWTTELRTATWTAMK